MFWNMSSSVDRYGNPDVRNRARAAMRDPDAGLAFRDAKPMVYIKHQQAF